MAEVAPQQIAYVALGSNLGDRLAQLRGGRAALTGTGIEVTASSPLYETAPEGGPAGQGPYLNAVLRLATRLAPPALLQRCLAIEDRFGRQRLEHWGPRTLDLDLLFFGALVLPGPELILPHPLLHRRRFVLAPLCDLAPELVHPVLGVTAGALLAALGPGDTPPRLVRHLW